MASPNVKHLTDTDFDNGISQGLTLVDFWAEWCGPCKALAPAIDKLADEFAGRVTVAKLDVDSNQRTPGKLGIRGIPTVMLFKDGQQLDVFVGNNPAKVREMVERAL